MARNMRLQPIHAASGWRRHNRLEGNALETIAAVLEEPTLI
jgi:hypothetical protein